MNIQRNVPKYCNPGGMGKIQGSAGITLSPWFSIYLSNKHTADIASTEATSWINISKAWKRLEEEIYYIKN